MVICKFFLQGNCRFGANCKYEHSYVSKYSYHAPLKNSTPAPQQQATGVTDEQLLNQVRGDIQSALKGGQWVLSSYAPFKEKAQLPGLTELSPEEARLFIYEAKASNNLDQAVTYMNNLIAEARHKYEQLLQPSAAIISVLRGLYNGESVSSPFTQGNFGLSSSAATSVFRSAVQSSPVFGLNQNSSNSPSIFAQANQNNAASIFGQANQNAASIFGQASQSAFGQNQQNQNTFGQTSPSQNTAASVFGQANQTSQNAASIFGQANQTLSPGSVFAQANQSNAASMFGQANTALTSSPTAKSVFAQAAQSQGVFGQPSQFQSIEPKSVFAQANQNIQQPNVFQIQQTAPSNVFGTFGSKSSDPFSQPVSLNAYSRMEELSQSDLEAYNSSEFKLGFVPMLPPPQELCV